MVNVSVAKIDIVLVIGFSIPRRQGRCVSDCGGYSEAEQGTGDLVKARNNEIARLHKIISGQEEVIDLLKKKIGSIDKIKEEILR